MAGMPRMLTGHISRAWVSPAVACRLRPFSSIAPRVAGVWGPGAKEGGEMVVQGEEGQASFRVGYKDSLGKATSPWHDLNLHPSQSGLFNMLVEIPKMTTAKMEVATKEPNNPIAQDTKKGKLRHYHGPIFWNYGMLPQTWEDPHVVHEETKCAGDNDPLDVVEIGSKALPMGTVETIKPLGVLAMIDDGELDWKVIGISIMDPLAAELNDVNDIEEKCPGVISGIREWFRWYKTPDGKPLNKFGYGEKCLDRKVAMDVIAEGNSAWKKLVNGQTEPGKLWVKTS